MCKIIKHFAVAAQEYSNVMGERFLADDSNYIDAEPMKNKTEGSMIKAYLALWEHLTATETVKPTTHIMDNEASAEYKKVIHKNCTLQLVHSTITDVTWQREQYKHSKVMS